MYQPEAETLPRTKLAKSQVGNDYLIEIDRVEGSDQLKISVEAEHPANEKLAH